MDYFRHRYFQERVRTDYGIFSEGSGISLWSSQLSKNLDNDSLTSYYMQEFLNDPLHNTSGKFVNLEHYSSELTARNEISVPNSSDFRKLVTTKEDKNIGRVKIISQRKTSKNGVKTRKLS